MPAPGLHGPYTSRRHATSACAAAVAADPSPRRRFAAVCASARIAAKLVLRRRDQPSTSDAFPDVPEGRLDATADASSSNARYLAFKLGSFTSGAANAASSSDVTAAPALGSPANCLGLTPSASVASRSHRLVAIAASSTDLALIPPRRLHASTSRGCARTPSTLPGAAKSRLASPRTRALADGKASGGPVPVDATRSADASPVNESPGVPFANNARCRNPSSTAAGVSMSHVLSTMTSAAVVEGGGYRPASGAAAAAAALATALAVLPSAKHSSLAPMCAPSAASWLPRTAMPGGTGACAPSSSPPSSAGGVACANDLG